MAATDSATTSRTGLRLRATRPILAADAAAKTRSHGTKRLYRARPEGLAPLKSFLEEFWDDRLELLKREAEREERLVAAARGDDPGRDPWLSGEM